MINPIKELARSREITLKELSILSGIKCQQIYHFAESRCFPSDDALQLICKVLKHSPSKLKADLQEFDVLHKVALEERLEELAS